MANWCSNRIKFRSVIEGTAKLRGQTALNLCKEFAIHGADALRFN